MKNFIYSATCIFFLAGFTYAQQNPQSSYSPKDFNDSNKFSVKEKSISQLNSQDYQKNTASISFYIDRDSFESAYPWPMVNEDFSDGPGEGIETDCGIIISNAGDDCFPEGVLEEGFSVTASTIEHGVSYFGTGSIGNTSPLVGASVDSDYTIINFPDGAYAVGLESFIDVQSDHNFRVYDTAGSLLINYMNSQPPNTETFFAVISDNEAIGRIEIEAAEGEDEVFGNLEFGLSSTAGLDENQLQGFFLYPNPTNDLIFLNSKKNMESVSLYNVLGQKLMEKNVDATDSKIDLSIFDSGTYFLKVFIDGQITSYKLLKN